MPLNGAGEGVSLDRSVACSGIACGDDIVGVGTVDLGGARGAKGITGRTGGDVGMGVTGRDG